MRWAFQRRTPVKVDWVLWSGDDRRVGRGGAESTTVFPCFRATPPLSSPIRPRARRPHRGAERPASSALNGPVSADWEVRCILCAPSLGLLSTDPSTVIITVTDNSSQDVSLSLSHGLGSRLRVTFLCFRASDWWTSGFRSMYQPDGQYLLIINVNISVMESWQLYFLWFFFVCCICINEHFLINSYRLTDFLRWVSVQSFSCPILQKKAVWEALLHPASPKNDRNSKSNVLA